MRPEDGEGGANSDRVVAYVRDVFLGRAITFWLLVIISWSYWIDFDAAASYALIGIGLNLLTGTRFGQGFSRLRVPIQIALHVIGVSLFSWVFPPFVSY